MPGYKVCVDSPRNDLQNVQIGIFADSLEHLKKKVQENLHLQGPVSVYLEDGTLVCDEDYFRVLEPQTRLRIRTSQSGHSWGQKRGHEDETILPPAKRSHNSFVASPTLHATVPAFMVHHHQIAPGMEQYYPPVPCQPTPMQYHMQASVRPLSQVSYMPGQPPNLTIAPRPSLMAPWQQSIQAVDNTSLVPRRLSNVETLLCAPHLPRRQAPPLLRVENVGTWTSPERRTPPRQPVSVSEVGSTTPTGTSVPLMQPSPVVTPPRPAIGQQLQQCSQVAAQQSMLQQSSPGQRSSPLATAKRQQPSPPQQSKVQPPTTMKNRPTTNQPQVSTSSPQLLLQQRSPVLPPCAHSLPHAPCTTVPQVSRQSTSPCTSVQHSSPQCTTSVQCSSLQSVQHPQCTSSAPPKSSMAPTTARTTPPLPYPGTNVPLILRQPVTIQPQQSLPNRSTNNNNSLPLLTPLAPGGEVIKLVSKYLSQQMKQSSIPSDLRLRKDSVDEGYASACTTASPSPSTPEPPVPVAIQSEEKVPEETTTTLPRLSSLTDMLASQPIPDILKADLADSSPEDEMVDVETTEDALTVDPPLQSQTSTLDSTKGVENSIPESDEADTVLHVESDTLSSSNFETANPLPLNIKQQSSPIKALSVTIPVILKNGQIRVKDGAFSVATAVTVPDSEIIVIDSDSDSDNEPTSTVEPSIKQEPMVKEEPADTKPNLDQSSTIAEVPVPVSEYASEETTLTSLPECTVGQVHEAVASLYSVALNEGQVHSVQTKSEIVSLLLTASKRPAKDDSVQTVLLESSTFDKEESEYIDLQTMLSELPEDVDVQDVCNVGNEVIVSDEMDILNESETLAAFLTSEIEVDDVYADSPEHDMETDSHPCLSPISKTIDSILVHADSISEADTSTIKGFLSGAPTDPRQKSKTFPIRRLENGSILSLQLNFSSGEWQGCVTAQN